MESSSSTGIIAVAAVAIVAILLIVLAYSGAFTPGDGGGIHIGIGR